jgi:hypothetical protein
VNSGLQIGHQTAPSATPHPAHDPPRGGLLMS